MMNDVLIWILAAAVLIAMLVAIGWISVRRRGDRRGRDATDLPAGATLPYDTEPVLSGNARSAEQVSAKPVGDRAMAPERHGEAAPSPTEVAAVQARAAEDAVAESQAAALAQRQAEEEAEQAELLQLYEQALQVQKLEAERRQAEEAERAEAQRLEEQRLDAERQEAQRRADEAARELEQARAAQAARAEAERVEAARLAAERAEAEALAAQRAEAQRLAAERIEADRVEAARLAAERADADRLAAERAEAERAEAERAEAERAEAERLATHRAEAERAMAEQQAAEAAKAERPPAADAIAHLPREQTLVMVVDDSKVVRVKINRLLAQHKYRTVLADSAEDAIVKIDLEVPHVLITDVEMPGMDGFGLTRHVRATARTAHVPVIMITSADDRQEAAARAGVSMLLGKPYPEDELIACIERARLAAPVMETAGA